MTPMRAGVALLMMSLLGVTVVVLRAELTRHQAVAQGHITRLITLRRDIWSCQMKLADAYTPEQIRRRATQWQLPLGASFDQWLTSRAADGADADHGTRTR